MISSNDVKRQAELCQRCLAAIKISLNSQSNKIPQYKLIRICQFCDCICSYHLKLVNIRREIPSWKISMTFMKSEKNKTNEDMNKTKLNVWLGKHFLRTHAECGHLQSLTHSTEGCVCVGIMCKHCQMVPLWSQQQQHCDIQHYRRPDECKWRRTSCVRRVCGDHTPPSSHQLLSHIEDLILVSLSVSKPSCQWSH